MSNILEDVKKYVGIHQDSDVFDDQLLININTVMLALNQFGIGPQTPFKATNESTWDELLGDVPENGIVEYVCMRVRMLFDPPTNTYTMQALENSISEFEWRILFDADNRNREEGAE